MQELLNKELYEWSSQEIDGFIVDAYLSLEATLSGQLLTADGLVVEPSMGDWGAVDDEDGTTSCQACLAGTFFVDKTGTLIPKDGQPSTYDYEETEYGLSVLTFLDGLRYLEEDGMYGTSMTTLLNTLGYAVIPAKEDNYSSHSYEKEVAAALKRFIDLNPRLTQKLQARTTNRGWIAMLYHEYNPKEVKSYGRR
jgi:hypothetical protein